MLLNIQNIIPVPCETSAFETAVLKVRYQGVQMTVFWVGIHRLPTDEELKNVMSACMLALTTDRLVLHFEHVSDTQLEIPTFDMIKNIVSTLMQNKDLFRKNLIGTIFESQVLDDKTKTMRDLFRSIYKPIRPFNLTDCKSDIENFAEQLSVNET